MKRSFLTKSLEKGTFMVFEPTNLADVEPHRVIIKDIMLKKQENKSKY